ncbi:C-type lectin lectoxin-Phi2-like [Eriocheir sinensis]|uniref:C-type lectin lectoxin-Phi2-like n=1 Tax=Eriocheir sinensis TaxID=95602 RepID=UPI0021C9441C|nr:C-type lectin lectoxin-Phi2-like [Eriocheir sinensis]XP_050711594.1 C-type lectin lectoxin-Phi2-like [Eriocheir sinensis]
MDGKGYGEEEIHRAETGDQWVCQEGQFVPFLETTTTSTTTSASSTTSTTTSTFSTTPAPTTTTASHMTFCELVKGGYIYLETSEMTWDDARASCRERDGDLLVTKDFDDLEEYMENFDITDVWIGGRGLQWLDGTNVTSHEWAESEPNDDEDACIKVKHYDSHVYLYDKKCCSTYESLCHLGAHYP